MFLFAGGDRRSLWTVRFLREQGLRIGTYHVPGMEDAPLPHRLSVVFLPFPVPQPMAELTQLLPMIDSNTTILCGMPGDHRADLERVGARVIDLSDTEPLTTMNAAITAECALKLLIEASEITLFGSRCLVIGAGRIGMLLGEKLRSLGAEVTVCARSPRDLARIRSRNLHAEETAIYRRGLCHYDFVINTVPAPIFTAEQIACLQDSCVLLELASSPGGFPPPDRDALGIRLIRGNGLPGRFAPKTAGILYGESLLAAIKKEGIL